MGVERIFLKSGQMTLFLVSNLKSPYYQSDLFGKLISYIGKYPHNCMLREKNEKRSMIIKNVKSVHRAVDILREMESL